MQVRCIKTCFIKRVWEEGEVMSIADGSKVPKHFEVIGKKKEKPVEKKKEKVIDTFKGIQDAKKKPKGMKEALNDLLD